MREFFLIKKDRLTRPTVQILAVLISIWVSYVFRMLFYIWYQLPDAMCDFMTKHPNWYATLQALIYIVGEAAPIIFVFTIQVL